MKQRNKETRKQTNRETKKARIAENRRVRLQIRYLKIDRFSQYSLNLGERPTEVLHFDIKTDPYKSALPKITRFENGTKKRIIWTQNGQKQGDRIFFRA